MIEQNNITTRSDERLEQAKKVIELAIDISENINPILTPGVEISYFDLYRKGSKNQFSGLTDFFRNYARGYDRESIDVSVEREFVWLLEQKKTSEYTRLPARGYIVKEGLMLGSLGKLIEFRHNKYDNYTVLNEQIIKDPVHIQSLLGEFATKNSIDYSTR